jgi:hypothetical protein
MRNRDGTLGENLLDAFVPPHSPPVVQQRIAPLGVLLVGVKMLRQNAVE